MYPPHEFNWEKEEKENQKHIDSLSLLLPLPLNLSTTISSPGTHQIVLCLVNSPSFLPVVWLSKLGLNDGRADATCI